MLSRLIGPFQVKEAFHLLAKGKELAEDLGEDLAFLHTLRRSFLPLPLLEQEPVLDSELFPPPRQRPVAALAGKKVGIIASGGSGVTACTLGVMRACEEAELEVAAIAACSGSVLFLAPIAAGLSAQEAVEFVLGWRLKDYLDPEWRQLLKIPLTLGRGFGGVIKAEAVEQLYRQRLGDVTLGELPMPFYADLWDLDHNRVVYMGTRTTPDLPLVRLVRAAITLPVYVQPLQIEGTYYGDGGVINIFPVDPLLQHHPEIDFFIGINAFYPDRFQGEDVSGWLDRAFSLVHLSPQALHGQHLEIARLQFRQIEDRCLLLQPVPYQEVKGVRFYEHFLDRRRWPEFIVRGYYHARRALENLDRS